MVSLTIAMLLAAPLLLLRVGSGSYKHPMSPEEEKDYLERAMSGDKAARDELIIRNRRLVAHIVKKYYANETDKDDLLQIGTVGLIRAISTYKPDKNVALSTYASTCIENEIRMYFRKKKRINNEVSIEEPLESDRDGNPLTLRELLAEDDKAFDNITMDESRMRVRLYMEEELDDIERKVIVWRYGIGGGKPMTQIEAAKLLGISRSYVSRIETRARKKLRARFDKEDS